MRILLADDHALFRDGLASLLAAWGHEIVGQASDGSEAIEAAERTRPELVLMDVRMPGTSGLEATRVLGSRYPEMAIVMLTVSEDETDLFEAIKAGARGYLFKSVDATQLRSMIEAVARGEAAITPATAVRILDLWARPDAIGGATGGSGAGATGSARDGRAPDQLTPRELEVLELVTRGLRNKEIAARLGITENTTKYHLRNILEKLHAESRTEVAARAVREGLFEGREGPV
jgi:DNA-binding NarL/FixJ family response regulator